MTFHFFGFFHWTVSNLIFCCVTVKTIYTGSLLNTPARNHFEYGFCPHIRTTILVQRDVSNKLKRSFTASILKWIVTLWIDFGATSSLRSTNAGVHAALVAFPR